MNPGTGFGFGYLAQGNINSNIYGALAICQGLLRNT